MPRIRGKAKEYAEEDFRKAVRVQQGYYDLMSQQALADAAGIPRPTLRKRLLEPEGMTVAELRKLVAAICPDPEAVLSLVGYSSKEIRQFRNKPAEDVGLRLLDAKAE